MQNNRVKVLQDKRYDYDGFGRLIRKRIGSHTEQRYRYNQLHQLTPVTVARAGKDGQPQSQVFCYQYDAFGRRGAETDSFGTTVFTWHGMRLLQERRGQHTSTYVYEPGSYVPLARIDGSGSVESYAAAAYALGPEQVQGKLASVPITNSQWVDQINATSAKAAANGAPSRLSMERAREGPKPKPLAPKSQSAQVYYFHAQPNGLSEELSDNNGNVLWTAQYTTWGSTVSEQWQSSDAAGASQLQPVGQAVSLQQNLRMQGQYLDRETGLHYNTFRYYDADLGAFTTPDPIGLNGGINLHQYAPNPTGWIDPWGWQTEPIRRYEDAAYHGKNDNAVKSRAPTNGQAALDNSVQVKPTSPRRVGVDVANKEIVVIDRTQVNADKSEKYHGHVRSYKDLHVDQQNALKRAGKVDSKGGIIGCKK